VVEISQREKIPLLMNLRELLTARDSYCG